MKTYNCFTFKHPSYQKELLVVTDDLASALELFKKHLDDTFNIESGLLAIKQWCSRGKYIVNDSSRYVKYSFQPDHFPKNNFLEL